MTTRTRRQRWRLIGGNGGFAWASGLLVIGVVAALVPGGLSGCNGSSRSLSAELRERSSREGLALTDGGRELVPFDRGPVWPAGVGTDMVWGFPSGVTVRSVWSPPGSRPCPDPLIVEDADGRVVWQLPGGVINETAVGASSDGLRVAFDGTYKPPGTGVLNTAENSARWITGLQVVDARTGTVTLLMATHGLDMGPDAVLLHRVGRISWAPSGNALTYDFEGRVYVREMERGDSRVIAEGTVPEWSPDGSRIAFRTPNGRAALLEVASGKVETLPTAHPILWSVQWSPDGRYVIFGEPVSASEMMSQGRFGDVMATGQMVVTRIADKASVPVYMFGFKGTSERGWFWLRDYRRFAEHAAVKPPVRLCDGA